MNWPNTKTIDQNPEEIEPGWTPYQREKDAFMANFTAQKGTMLKGLGRKAIE